MTGVAESIFAVTPIEALDLETRGKAGDAEAMKTWVLYAVWQRIAKDRTIHPKHHKPLFRALTDQVTITVEAEAAHG